MRELNKTCQTPVGIVYTKFADIRKIAPKLRISILQMMHKRHAFLFVAMGLIVFVCSSFSESFLPQPKEDMGIKKVVIDAGHGGKDPGTLGIEGLKEKNVVLDIALKLGKRIKDQNPDVEVVYTRDNDTFIPLHERAKIANERGADLFISVHANSASPGAYGTECYVLGLHRTKENLETAKRENATILMEENYDVKYEGFDPNSDESYIALSLQQSLYLDQSLNMASKVQEEFERAGRRNRGVRQAGFLVLYKTTMPSILVEVGFVTNPKEGKELATPEIRTKLTDAIYKAFGRYKSEIEGTIKLTSGNEGEKKTIIKPTKSDEGVVFKVQIAAMPKPMEITSTNFKGLTDVTEYKVGETYKYMVGHERDFKDAVNLQNEIREKAYKDAFVVAFYNGEKITISKAFELKKSNP